MSFPSLSKSQFIRGLQCQKSLWLYQNNPELRTEPGASQQAIFDQGHEVGLLAQKLFPGGETIEFEGSSFDEKVEKTRNLIDDGVQTIYEATFKYENIVVMVDILHKGKQGWELYEVKASTSVKNVHKQDVAIQYFVVSGSDLTLNSASLIHINNQYLRKGDLNLQQLFSIVDLTEVAAINQEMVEEQLFVMRTVLNNDEPDIDIGPHCNFPYECDFKEHCWSHIPGVSVFNLNRLGENKKFELYYKGIIRFDDLPEDARLTPSQKMQVEAEQTGKEFIDPKRIRQFIDTIHYPLYFLDFETVAFAVPQFDGLCPYQQIPFQYSIHFQDSESGELKHIEFLGDAGTDPRKLLAKSLSESIPVGACVLTYNARFEKSVIQKLANQFPEYFDSLMNINDHIVDLMHPFQKKYVYTKAMKGKYSIKYVLPALVPELNHAHLEISDGFAASSTYAQLHLVKEKNAVEEIRKNLLEYCKLDTFAMVRVLGKLKDMVQI